MTDPIFDDITDTKTTRAIDAMDKAMAKEIAGKLLEVYPGYVWVIDADSRKGGVTLLCGQVQDALNTKFPYKFWLPMEKLATHGIMVKKCVMAAGEILERARMPRGAFSGDTPKQVDGVQNKHQPVIIDVTEKKYG